MKKYRILFIFIIFIYHHSFSQELKDSTQASKHKIIDALRSLEPYGTLEIAFGGSKNGWGVVDGVSRTGVTGEWKIDDNYFIFMTAEIGVNLVRRNDFIDIVTDPGGSFGKENDVFFSRKGFIGLGSPYGNISLGKQWGVHYAIAGNVDNMYFFGGTAISVYNAGTDGGVSGTGRADNAVKYELFKNNFYIGVQGQFRNISINDQTFADTYGIASFYKLHHFKIGVSYNKVLDGIEDPIKGEAKIDDENFSFLLDYSTPKFHFAIINNFFTNHEKTDEGTFYDGWSFEYNLKYNFGKEKEWSFVHNTAYMKPNSGQNTKFIKNRFDFEIVRRFSLNTLIASGYRFENSTFSNDSKNKLHTFYIGFYYNFNYPVP